MYDNLKKLRLSTGLNQAAFGESVGVKKATYSNYEVGKTQPGSDFWIAVAEKYDVSIDWLMGFTDDPKRSKFATPSALDKKYAALDAHGRRVVDMVIDVEWGSRGRWFKSSHSDQIMTENAVKTYFSVTFILQKSGAIQGNLVLLLNQLLNEKTPRRNGGASLLFFVGARLG